MTHDGPASSVLCVEATHAPRSDLTVHGQLNDPADLEGRASSTKRASGIAVLSACPTFRSLASRSSSPPARVPGMPAVDDFQERPARQGA